jgi:hypothetical protein
MQDPPAASELLESVRHYIETEVVSSAADARARFRALVAANVLQVAAREWEIGAELERAEAARLAALLAREGPAGDLNVELARRIRAGEVDAAPGGRVWEHLRLTVLEKLRVANPRHLARIEEAGGGGGRSPGRA